MTQEKCIRCGWDWDGEPSKWRRGSATPDGVCNTCWYSEIMELRSPERASAREMCSCGSGLPRYEGACPACYPSVQRATADSALCLVRTVGTDEPLPRCEAYPKCVCGGPEGWPDEPRSSAARHARVISGTGDSGERRELAALVRGLRDRPGE